MMWKEIKMIVFEHVSKFVLDGVSFCVPKGESVGVIGASGAGKTTMLKLVCGLLAPSEGEVYTIRKDPVRERKALIRQMAAVFAGIPIFSEYDSVRQSFEDLKEIYGMESEEFESRYERLGELLGFKAYEETCVKNLSLGQRRRAELGTVFLKKPELIVLDEPGIGLDQNAKGILQELLRERKDAGATILLSSHDMDEIAGACDRILFLDQGQVVFYGAKDMLLRQYAPMDVCELEFAESEFLGKIPKIGEQKMRGGIQNFEEQEMRGGILDFGEQALCVRIPDFADLPIEHYELEKNHLKIVFNSNHISAAEILAHVMAQVKVRSVNVRKGNLLDSVKNIVK